MNRFLLFLLICCCHSLAWGQYTITGRVVDTDTKEGIPFANVFFEGTTLGASSDIDGYYELKVKKLNDTLSASAIGFETQKKAIQLDSSLQEVNFYLGGSALTLDEVVVIAGENPANRIVRGIIQEKEKNRIDALNSFQYESYAKIELDLDLRPEGKNGPLVRSLASYREYYARWSLVWEAHALLRATPALAMPGLLRAQDRIAARQGADA